MEKGESFGIIGESGSGKTTLARAIVGLVNENNAWIEGEIFFEDRQIIGSTFDEMNDIRGKGIFMIFQDSNTHLNPVLKISSQITEVLPNKNFFKKSGFSNRLKEIFNSFGFNNHTKILKGYPHQFSGGEKQRIMIIMALLRRPRLIIADEPTSSLDSVTKLIVLSKLQRMQGERHSTMMLITHDLNIIASMTKRAAVLYKGQIIEIGSVDDLFNKPAHPYTQLLLDCAMNRPVSYSCEDDVDSNSASCDFFARCKHHEKICKAEEPPLRGKNGHKVKCWMADKGAT